MGPARTIGGAVLCAIGAAGCVSFQPRPLDPYRSEAEYRERSLASPGLRAFVGERDPERAREWPPASWDLGSLTLVGLHFSPELEVARARVGAVDAAVQTAGGRPNPDVDLDATHRLGDSKQESPWSLALAPSLTIETAGKRRYRIERGRSLAEAARLDLADGAWHVRSRIRRRLLDHVLALSELDRLREEEAARLEAVARLGKRLAVGAVSRPEVATARSDQERTSLGVSVAQGKVTETRAALAEALGMPAAALAEARFSWPDVERLPAEEMLSPQKAHRAGLLNRLDVRRALAEYAASEAALRLEIAKQYPDLRLGPLYGQNRFGLGLGLPVALLNRNRGPIVEAEARCSESAARFSALQAQVIAETDGALAGYRASLDQLGAARAIEGTLETREAAARRAVEAGELDRFAVLGLRLERLAAASARVDAVHKAQAALGALEDALQRPLSPDDTGLPEASGTDSGSATTGKERRR